MSTSTLTVNTSKYTSHFRHHMSSQASYCDFYSRNFTILIGKIGCDCKQCIGKRMQWSLIGIQYSMNLLNFLDMFQVLKSVEKLCLSVYLCLCFVKLKKYVTKVWYYQGQLSPATRLTDWLTDTISGYLWQFAPAVSCHLAPTGVEIDFSGNILIVSVEYFLLSIIFDKDILPPW